LTALRAVEIMKFESTVYPRVQAFSWLTILLAASSVALIGQLFPYLWPPLAWLFGGICHGLGALVSLVDVRNWQWTWSVYFASLDAGWAFIAVIDPRHWGWTTFATLSGLSIVALTVWKAWWDQRSSS
jgi:hypothetical protein